MRKIQIINMMRKLIIINRIEPFLLFSLILMISGCAHVISKHLRDEVDPSLTFRQVHQNPNAYRGKFVMWGGEIIETVNQKDGTTLIEVFQRPLGRRGGAQSHGSLRRKILNFGQEIFRLLPIPEGEENHCGR